MENIGYFSLSHRASKELKETANLAWVQTMATFPLPLASIDTFSRKLKSKDIKGLRKYTISLQNFRKQYPNDQYSKRNLALHDNWLKGGKSFEHIATRLDVACDTGYFLLDKNPDPNSNASWNDHDLKRIQMILTALPPNLKYLAGLLYITRDTLAYDDELLFNQFEAAFRDAKGCKKFKYLPIQLVILLAHLFKVGVSFGSVYFKNREIRLYNELFLSSRLPGFNQLAAYTMIHEIGHLQLEFDPILMADWEDFYCRKGRDEAFCNYAANSLHEGYGVSLGVYAVAPDILKEKSPQTYAFFLRKFGKTLQTYRGKGLESWAIGNLHSYMLRFLKCGPKNCCDKIIPPTFYALKKRNSH